MPPILAVALVGVCITTIMELSFLAVSYWEQRKETMQQAGGDPEKYREIRDYLKKTEIEA